MFNIIKREDWMSDALCGDGKHDPDDWFPGEGKTQTPKRAKKTCLACPVMMECREYAVTFPASLSGVWGGWSRYEIRTERVRRGIKSEDNSAYYSGLPKSPEAYDDGE